MSFLPIFFFFMESRIRAGELGGLLHYREPDEDGAVPEGVGDDDGSEAFGEEAVGEAPDEAGYHGCHDQHEVELRDVDEAVDEGCDDESDVGIPAFRKTVLDAAPPEYLLRRADDEEHQQRQDYGVLAFFHAVDQVNLRAGEIKKKGREEFSEPEDSPEGCGETGSKRDVAEAEAQVFPPAGPRPACEEGEGGSRAGHHDPEVDVRCSPWGEHDGPEDQGYEHADDRLFQ